ncbi:hypothetical protein ABIB49_003435 [Arthrobacter sp. UYCu512]|uniref:hypothetical protein n=1 Tax=Arthrobacter sp. UYCu512 TaxID=3156338 RepID=UPI0033948275
MKSLSILGSLIVGGKLALKFLAWCPKHEQARSPAIMGVVQDIHNRGLRAVFKDTGAVDAASIPFNLDDYRLLNFGPAEHRTSPKVQEPPTRSPAEPGIA